MATVKEKQEEKTTVKIKLPRAPRGQDNFIIAGWNGKMYQIKRGEEVEVPWQLAEQLQVQAEIREEGEDFIVSLT